MDLSNFWWSGAGGGPGPGPDPGDPIGQSLRFRGAQYLTRSITFTNTATISLWIKVAKITSGYDTIIDTGWKVQLVIDNYSTNNERLALFMGHGGNLQAALSDGKVTDPSAWYHVFRSYDPSEAGGNRGALHINGVKQRPETACVLPSGVATFKIGQDPGFRGYMADFHYVDGQALDPTTFGRFNANDVWVPVDPKKDGDTIWYGANGFHLTFADPGNVGKDYSGNGNDFTATGFETANQTSPLYDIVQDSPTNNFATLNPIECGHPNTYFGVLADANLASAQTQAYSTVHPVTIKSSGQYYCEFINTSGNSCALCLRTAKPGLIGSRTGVDTYLYTSDGRIYEGSVVNAGGPVITTGDTWTVNDVIGMAFDFDTNRLRYYKNGVEQCDVTISPVNSLQFGVYNDSGNTPTINFGQQPFKYTPPAGFEPLSTASMPAAPITNGRDHFQAITGPGSSGGVLWLESTTDPGNVTFPLGTLTNPIYNGSLSGPFIGLAHTFIWDAGGEINGPITLNFVHQAGNHSYATSLDGQTWFGVFSDNGTTITINPGQPFRYVRKYSTVAGNQGYSTSDGIPILGSAQAAFPSGLWWIKDRANANEHQLVDSVRGGNLALTCPTNNASQAYVAPTGESVAWCWNYNSADPSQNGFDVVGPITGTIAQRTIPHNLGAPPKFIIARGLASGQPPCTYHSEVGAGGMMYLSSSNGVDSRDVFWGGVEPTSTEFTVGNSTHTNPTSEIIYYLWSEIPGYSAFGSYTGNSNADGPFVYLGFRPAFVMFKTITATNWSIQDSARAPYNPCVDDLVPNSTSGESGAAMNVDFLSNGFKVRIGNANINSSTVLYCAFAENPFQSPVTAR